MRDLSSLIGVFEAAQPDEIYNLGAISFVGLSFKQPEPTGDITGMGVLRMLEAIRIYRQGSMDEHALLSGVEFGDVWPRLDEDSASGKPRSFIPVHRMEQSEGVWSLCCPRFRESYNAWACSGILFNHESPRRGL